MADADVEMSRDVGASDSRAGASSGAGSGAGAGSGSGSSGASLPWIEKYRPSSLDDLIAHDHIISTINRLIDANKLPHLLLYGPPGTGKTSTITACAKRLYGADWRTMTLELNASDDRGISVVRDQIKNFAGTMKLFSSGVKLVILDEADAMTPDAQFALRRVIERYTKNARFCLICNYVSKIIPALQSRCTRFRFAPLKKEQVRGRLQEIISKERLTATKDGVDAILRLSNGDMRKVLNILQATSMSHGVVDGPAVYTCTGEPLPADLDRVMRSLMNDDFNTTFNMIQDLQRGKGIALSDIVTHVAKITASLKLPPAIACPLITKMADIEYALAFATKERVQAGALVGAFAVAKEELASAASAAAE